MTMNHDAAMTLEVQGSERAGATAKRYANRVAWFTARAVEKGMEGAELRGYIKGLSAMAGAISEAQTADFNESILKWDEAMTKAGKELPFNVRFNYRNDI